jgi:hypothetical protein
LLVVVVVVAGEVEEVLEAIAHLLLGKQVVQTLLLKQHPEAYQEFTLL